MKDQNTIFAANLARLVENSGKTQREIAFDLDVTPQTFNAWLQRKALPRMGKIQRIADYFGVEKSALMDEVENNPTCVSVPILGNVAAGIPITAITDIRGYEFISASRAAGSILFALKIKGESMIPRIWDGDVVIVRKQPTAESGDIVIAQVGREEATCKKLRIVRDGIELHPLNPAYPVLYYSADDIESYPVEILGKVIESRRSY